MSDGTIEILGQKLSYPASWHGVAAVISLCMAITIIALIFTKWMSPENLVNALNYATVQENKVAEISRANQVLLDQIGDLESQLKNATLKLSQKDEQEKIKNEVAELQKQREIMYSTLESSERNQANIINTLAPQIGGQKQVQILQQQQQQQRQVQQQQQQIQQQMW